MRKAVTMWLVAMTFLVPAQAAASGTASFGKYRVGGGASVFSAHGESVGVDWGLPLFLEGGIYLENGFELFVQAQLLLLQVKTGADTTSGRGTIVRFGGRVAVRYLFLEESIRPYVALHLAILERTATQWYLGPGASAGCDFFVAESVSLGVRASGDTLWTLNTKPSFSVGGGLDVMVYF